MPAEQTPTISPEEAHLPPQNIEAEQSVLGALMLDRDAVVKIADTLRADDFYRDQHRIIFEAMLDLYESQEPIDVLTLSNKLREKEQLETVGGETYLTKLVSTVPSATHVTHYAKIVQRKGTLRRLIKAASGIQQLGYSEKDNVEELLDKAEQTLFSVSQKHSIQNFLPMKSALEEAFYRIEELHKGERSLRGVGTGYKELDNIMAGLQKSDLVILAARPSLGKTSLALDFARHAAIHEKVPVGIFSLEMSQEQLVDRMICAEAKVDLWKLRTGKLSAEGDKNDFERINRAMGLLSEAPVYIDDSASSNVLEMRTMARRLQSERGLGLIIVDYLQLMEGGNIENRVQAVSEMSRSLKSLARELNIPVVALSQLSRAVESRPDQVPRLSDLRESGSIEQDADVVIFIHRPDRIEEKAPKNVASLIIAKHRNGPTGQVDLFFNDQFVSFSSIETKREEMAIPEIPDIEDIK